MLSIGRSWLGLGLGLLVGCGSGGSGGGAGLNDATGSSAKLRAEAEAAAMAGSSAPSVAEMAAGSGAGDLAIVGAQAEVDADAGIIEETEDAAVIELAPPPACSAGYVLNSDNVCTDVDECATPGICSVGQACTNTEGSFTCAATWAKAQYLIPDSGHYRNMFDVARGDDGSIYVVGFDAATNAMDGFVMKYDANAALVYTKILALSLTSNDRISAVAAEGENCYVALQSDETDSVGNTRTTNTLMKLDGAGSTAWSTVMGTPFPTVNLHVVGSELWAAGSDMWGGNSATTGDVFVAHYDMDGNELSMTVFGNSGAPDQVIAGAMDGQGNLVLVGLTSRSFLGHAHLGDAGHSNLFVVKLDATSSILWSAQLGGSGDTGSPSVAIDNDDNIFISGWANGSFDGKSGDALKSDVFLVKYTAAGHKVFSNWIPNASPVGGAHQIASDGTSLYLTTSLDYSDVTTQGIGSILTIDTDGGIVSEKRYGDSSYAYQVYFYGMKYLGGSLYALGGAGAPTITYPTGRGAKPIINAVDFSDMTTPLPTGLYDFVARINL